MAALLSNTFDYAANVLRGLKVKPNEKGEGPGMILSARGTFYLVKLAETYGPGIYSIDELTRITGRSSEYWKQNSPILLTSIEFNQVDITSQVPCLNNVKVFYSFGQNFGQVVIQGEVLLGPLGDLSYVGVERLVSFFWKNRVSVKHEPIAVSVADNAYFVYLTGLRIGQVNPDFHIMPFAMFGTLLDITRENTSKINVRGQVFTGGAVNEPSLFSAMQQMPVGMSASTPAVESPAIDFMAEIDKAEIGTSIEGTPKTGSIIPAGNAKAVEVARDLVKDPLSQQEKDLKLLKDERSKAQVELAQLKRDSGISTSTELRRLSVEAEVAQAQAKGDKTAGRSVSEADSAIIAKQAKISMAEQNIVELNSAVRAQEKLVVRARNLDVNDSNTLDEVYSVELDDTENLSKRLQAIKDVQAPTQTPDQVDYSKAIKSNNPGVYPRLDP